MTSNTKDDGGSAYPMPASDGMHAQQYGMSLRDYFAGQALAGVISECKNDTRRDGQSTVGMFAEKAYTIADAMLAARGAK